MLTLAISFFFPFTFYGTQCVDMLLFSVMEGVNCGAMSVYAVYYSPFGVRIHITVLIIVCSTQTHTTLVGKTLSGEKELISCCF